MTKRQMVIQILSEVMGVSESEMLDRMTPAFRRMEFKYPGSTKGFAVELGDAEAQATLALLRSEKEGVLAWLVEGAAKAHRDGWAE